jgi:aerobic-type carbon monoxide dehydrogenase small subunit (CoxS/CutS family)
MTSTQHVEKKGVHGGNMVSPVMENICRCAGYVNIVEAIALAAKGGRQ